MRRDTYEWPDLERPCASCGEVREAWVWNDFGTFCHDCEEEAFRWPRNEPAISVEQAPEPLRSAAGATKGEKTYPDTPSRFRDGRFATGNAGGPGRKRVHRTGAERSRAHRLRKRKEAA